MATTLLAAPLARLDGRTPGDGADASVSVSDRAHRPPGEERLMDDLPTRSVFGVRCEEEGIVTGIPDMQYLVLHRDQGKFFFGKLFFSGSP